MTPEELIGHFLTDNQQYAVICMDAQGVITAWRGAAEAVFGYSAEEMVGQRASELFLVEDRARGFDEQELDIARKVGHAEDDRWHVRKDGTRIWVIGATQAIRDRSGVVAGFVKLARDRTDLRSWTEKLESESSEAAAAHERTLAFLRTLGHEMRNPLAPLNNAAHIIERLHGDERTRKTVEIIRNQTSSLQRLAEELMRVAQLEAGAVALDLQIVDLRQPVSRAVAGLQQIAQDKGVHLEALSPSGPLWVSLDEGRFQQVLMNLISNSIKYTPSGGSIWVKPTQEGREVVLRVEDTGIGIDAVTLPRIFDLFSRELQAAQVDPQGLGIGLAVVREVVELHRGSVQARSGGIGRGAEFTVRLPAEDPQSIDSE